ncbi:MAG: RNA 2'-phosphotransferase [Candidatus Adiutricales bacterium]
MPKQKQQRESLIRMLNYVLGHHPDEFGLVPDEEGFVPKKELIQALHEEEGWTFVRESHLQPITLENNKLGIEFTDKMIRVSPEVTRLDLGPRPEVAPPALLYFGARRRAYPAILKYGLLPAGSPWVALYSEKEMALRVGERRDRQPILLTILAEKAYQRGTRFFGLSESVFLVEKIAPDLFSGPPLPKEKPVPEKKKPAPTPTQSPTPGSFLLDPERDPDPGRRMKRSKRSKGKGDPDWKRSARKQRREKYQ